MRQQHKTQHDTTMRQQQHETTPTYRPATHPYCVSAILSRGTNGSLGGCTKVDGSGSFFLLLAAPTALFPPFLPPVLLSALFCPLLLSPFFPEGPAPADAYMGEGRAIMIHCSRQTSALASPRGASHHMTQCSVRHHSRAHVCASQDPRHVETGVLSHGCTCHTKRSAKCTVVGTHAYAHASVDLHRDTHIHTYTPVRSQAMQRCHRASTRPQRNTNPSNIQADSTETPPRHSEPRHTCALHLTDRARTGRKWGVQAPSQHTPHTCTCSY